MTKFTEKKERDIISIALIHITKESTVNHKVGWGGCFNTVTFSLQLFNKPVPLTGYFMASRILQGQQACKMADVWKHLKHLEGQYDGQEQGLV